MEVLICLLLLNEERTLHELPLNFKVGALRDDTVNALIFKIKHNIGDY